MSDFILELKNMRKEFGGVIAVDGVDLHLKRGELLSIAGDNGAGKSTLVKIITGVHKPTSGEMHLNGKLVNFNSPREAADAGIAAVYQDLSLCDNLSAAANLTLGQEPRLPGWRGRLGLLDIPRAHELAQTALTEVGIQTLTSTATRATYLSGGQRQAVALVRAALEKANIIVLDEPTAALGIREREMVYSLVDKLRDQNYGIILVSHSVPEIVRLAARVMIFRLGKVAAVLEGSAIKDDAIVSAITGSRPEGGDRSE